MWRRREEKKERRVSFLSLSSSFSYAISTLAPPHFPFGHNAPSQWKNKGNLQNRSYHLIIDERNEKNRSKSIFYEGNDRILLSESNLSSGFPVLQLNTQLREQWNNFVIGEEEEHQYFSRYSTIWLVAFSKSYDPGDNHVTNNKFLNLSQQFVMP